MKIDVYVFAPKGKILCICKASRKLCERKCEIQKVIYDQYQDYEECMRTSKYGK